MPFTHWFHSSVDTSASSSSVTSTRHMGYHKSDSFLYDFSAYDEEIQKILTFYTCGTQRAKSATVGSRAILGSRPDTTVLQSLRELCIALMKMIYVVSYGNNMHASHV